MQMHPRNYLRAVAVSIAGGGGRCVCEGLFTWKDDKVSVIDLGLNPSPPPSMATAH